jgi:hypothetical protein
VQKCTFARLKQKVERGNMTKYSGILTAGGNSPGLNAAIRGIGKAAGHPPGDSLRPFG